MTCLRNSDWYFLIILFICCCLTSLWTFSFVSLCKENKTTNISSLLCPQRVVLITCMVWFLFLFSFLSHQVVTHSLNIEEHERSAAAREQNYQVKGINFTTLKASVNSSVNGYLARDGEQSGAESSHLICAHKTLGLMKLWHWSNPGTLCFVDEWLNFLCNKLSGLLTLGKCEFKCMLTFLIALTMSDVV